MTILFLCFLCLLNTVKASTYSCDNNRPLEMLYRPSSENYSYIASSKESNKSCEIPKIFKPFFKDISMYNVDEIDGKNIDNDCCCPTKRQFLSIDHDDPYLINTSNQRKKLAFGECKNIIHIIRIGYCSKQSDSCGQCKNVKQIYNLLIEENGELVFDKFKLPSYCICNH
ncbi:unnamed protein product [Acanthosepion pharaonis]|uniref:Spaetzle domain-containing protein n=1 Tax=Acanthosepion pharaonis TaxID=158019 RepID=A0A812D5T8_ACAPH|nr:unnamed protein product [Sepia pharaonis]